MRLSTKNELFLKENIVSEDIQGVIDEISGQIESLEKEMTTKFHAGYLDVIRKCSVLEQLHGDVEEMKSNSMQLLNEAEDIQLKQASLHAEYDGIQLAMERLGKVQQGFASLQEFLAQAVMLEGSDSIYESVCGLKRMGELKLYFKQYNFYKVVKDCYASCHGRFMGVLRREASDWMDRLDFVSLGGSIEVGPSHRIFDEVGLLKRVVMDTNILKVVYASRQLGAEKSIAELLDERRESLLLRMVGGGGRLTSNDDILHFAISFILIGQFITEVLPPARPFCNEVLDLIKDHEFDDISTVAALKRAIVAAGLQTEKFDEIVEKTAFRYLEQRIGKEHFIDDIKRFIRRTTRLLAQVSDFSSELDDLFAKKVDEQLGEYLAGFDEGARDRDGRFAGMQEEIEGVLDELFEAKPALSRFNFSVHERIDEANARYVDQKYGEVAERIRHATEVDKIVDAILSLKGFMNRKCMRSLVARLDENVPGLLSHRKKDDIELVQDTMRRNFLEDPE